jgi:hypothetical protein
MKSRRGWVGYVAFMGDRSSTCRILVGKPEGKKENPHIGGRIILKWILER